MSADLQPAPAPAPNDSAPSPKLSPPGPARTHEQLAHLLAKAYGDIDALNRDLAQTRRRADKAERVVQSLTAVAETSTSNGAAQSVPEHITRVIHELEDRLAHAELARDESEARRRFVLDQWFQVDSHFNALDIKAQETRHSFTRVLRDGVPVSLSPISNPFPVSLPPHPGPSLRRPRTPSLDANYPPSKRARGNDVRGREHRITYVEANVHGAMDAAFARQHGAVRVIQQPGDKYPTSRPRSSSRSSTSSIDVDEMLLQASTGDEHPGPNGAVASASPHITMPLQPQGSQQIQSSHRSRRRHGEIVDGRPPIRMSEVEAMQQYHRRPGHIESSPYPASQSVPRKPQEQMQPGGQIQTYQTHIFAPPVTGAPIKKSKYSSMTVSAANLTPHGSSAVLDAPPQPGKSPAPLVPNFPPVNAQGQRICRQCGQAGRYKEGKCVEKWGPGPAGPGTVCDRCRKKMKRVERRGTLETQQQLAAAQLAAASASVSGGPTQQHQPHVANDRSLQRSDTLPLHFTASPSSRDKVAATGPNAAAPLKVSHVRTIMHPPSSVSAKDNRASPHAHRPMSILDEAPTSNVGRGSRNTSRTRDGGGAAVFQNGHSKSPGEKMMMSLVVDATDSDADAEAEAEGEGEESVIGGRGFEEDEEEDVDAEEEGDAEADGDAEAELLEAVDAAEANSNAGSS